MKTAMILAAGRGERLRPITDSLPKPLCVINGIPLIERHIMQLVKANFSRIIINHAYLGWKIRQHLGHGERFGIEICYSPEPPGALETGGGIVNALPLLGDEPFLTVNADSYTDFSFDAFALPDNSLAHLLLVKKPTDYPFADFGLTAIQRLDNANRTHTFAGIAAYDPCVFNCYKPGRYSVTPLLRQLAEQSKATGQIYDGKWLDIGSIGRLKSIQDEEYLDAY